MSARDLFHVDDAFVTYEAQLQIRDFLVGGVPSGPSTIRNWLRARLDAGDTELEEIIRETMAERNSPMSIDEQLTLLMASDASPSVNGFKRMPTGELAYESRCLKGGFKEWANSAYPGLDWDGKWASKDPAPEPAAVPDLPAKGKRKPPARKAVYGVAGQKGLLSTAAERVFFDPPLIGLGVTEPSAVEERIKRVRLPDGRPASAISRVEVVEKPLLTFVVKIRDNFLSDEALGRIWMTGEEIGIGADRARSDGRFDLVSWKRIS